MQAEIGDCGICGREDTVIVVDGDANIVCLSCLLEPLCPENNKVQKVIDCLNAKDDPEEKEEFEEWKKYNNNRYKCKCGRKFKSEEDYKIHWNADIC